MKRHYELAEGISFGAFIETAIAANSGGHHARNHFSHSGVSVQDD